MFIFKTMFNLFDFILTTSDIKTDEDEGEEVAKTALSTFPIYESAWHFCVYLNLTASSNQTVTVIFAPVLYISMQHQQGVPGHRGEPVRGSVPRLHHGGRGPGA